MSSTNKTTNYQLSQFGADDKPAWLGDYNSDMQKIDTNMKAIDTKAESAETNAQNANTSASQALETANNANTTANGANSNATNALSLATNANDNATTAKQNSETALSTANNASGSASSALSMAQNANTNATKALNGLNKFNLSNSQTISQSGIIGQTNIAQVNESSINIISDSTNEVFKLYGNIKATASASETVEVSIQSNLRPNEEITIVNAGICMYNTESHMDTVNMIIQTNGIIKFTSWLNPAYLGDKTFKMVLLNCLYFLDAFEQIVPEPGQ